MDGVGSTATLDKYANPLQHSLAFGKLLTPRDSRQRHGHVLAQECSYFDFMFVSLSKATRSPKALANVIVDT